MMKRLLIVATPILAVMVSLFSCASPDPKVSVIAFGNKIQNITFKGNETEKVEWLYFTDSWSCNHTADWIQVTPMSHAAKNAGRLDSLEVTFKILSPATTERRAGVTFSQDGASVRIPVIQEAAAPAN